MKGALYPVLAAGLFLAWSDTIQAKEIEGVKIPSERVVSGRRLYLNGAGLRSFVFLGVPVKVYVASFYSASPLRSGRAVMALPGPMQMNFTFLQSVGKAQVAAAWRAQFDASASFTYPQLSADKAAFVAMFGALKKGGVQTVEFDGETARVYDDGVFKGTIRGRDFQRAFLSIWFGSRPVTRELKQDLLGG